jgi:4-diphosphocytidyl-2-C-methyl-D-erythritol kinase
VPDIADVLRWLDRQSGLKLVRMSGSGATCFGLFESDSARDEATVQCPAEWWHLATSLR